MTRKNAGFSDWSALATPPREMRWAEAIDALRIFPRFMLVGYGLWVVYFVGRIMQFYFDLEPAARSTEVTAFCTLVIGAVTGFSAPIFSIYNASARNWDQYYMNLRQLLQNLPTPPPGQAQAQVTTTTRIDAPAPEATS